VRAVAGFKRPGAEIPSWDILEGYPMRIALAFAVLTLLAACGGVPIVPGI
jgi:hypothetical protein